MYFKIKIMQKTILYDYEISFCFRGSSLFQRNTIKCFRKGKLKYLEALPFL